MLAVDCQNLRLSDIFAIDWSFLLPDMSKNPTYDGFAARHSAVLEKLYQDIFPTVRKFVLSNNGSVDDASDVLQDAMVAAWLNVQQGKFKVSGEDSLQAYITQIARYKWLDQLKSSRMKYSSRLENVKEPMEMQSDEVVEALDASDYTARLFGILGEQCKKILTLFYYDKRSLEQIGSALNFPAESIRTMKYRCMMKLRTEHEKMKESSHE